MQNLKAKKSLGQNFLKDENVLNKIANSIDTNRDLIIEIGPGMGALTKKLQKKNSYVLAYEINERTKEYLLPLENNTTKIIYITTPIIEHIIKEKLNVKAMTLLVQKEVANRFSSKPKSKEYGAITVYLNNYFNIEKLFDVKNTCFNPVPKVDSAVVKFIKKDDIFEDSKFYKFLNICFAQKRKTLKNNLKDFEWNKVKEILEKNNISENCRAEELDLEIFKEIFFEIGK